MPSPSSLFPTAAALLRRWSGRPRRIAAALCALAAALLALAGIGGGPPDEPVAVAARDVPAGAVLTPDDVIVASWRSSAVPPGALRAAGEAVGQRVGAAMGAGEPITGLRLADGSYGGSLRPGAAAVIIAVDAQALLARAGDWVDIYATIAPIGDPAADAGDDAVARLVVAGARVLAALPGSGPAGDGQLVLEVDRTAIASVAAARSSPLTVVVTPPS